MEAVQRYGWKDVKSIAQHVGTRTPTQVRTHAQKLFLRQQKESSGMMAPAKNGRSDGLPPLPVPEGGEGGGGGDGEGTSADGAPSQADQLRALQDASYQLAQGSSEMDAMGDMDMGSAAMANMSNPDAAPAGAPGMGDEDSVA
jgi:hypothetical protein